MGIDRKHMGRGVDSRFVRSFTISKYISTLFGWLGDCDQMPFNYTGNRKRLAITVQPCLISASLIFAITWIKNPLWFRQ